MEEDKEEEFTLEKPKQLFYADIVPGYAEMNANKKKKIRRKKQNELREANEKALREWEQKKQEFLKKQQAVQQQ